MSACLQSRESRFPEDPPSDSEPSLTYRWPLLTQRLGVCGSLLEDLKARHNCCLLSTTITRSPQRCDQSLSESKLSALVKIMTSTSNSAKQTVANMASKASGQEAEEEDFGVLIYREYQRRKAEAAAAAAAAESKKKKSLSAVTTRRTSTSTRKKSTPAASTTTEKKKQKGALSTKKRRREDKEEEGEIVTKTKKYIRECTADGCKNQVVRG